jgi:glycosyltransferase involved in cell wall biosynthesis
MSRADPTSRSVLLVVEQLRRRVPGGIGTYVRGLLTGLARLEEHGGQPFDLTLYASRAAPDPLDGLGRPIRTSPLPSPLLTRAWDRGLAHAPRGATVVHGLSLASPPIGRGDPARLVVTVHDLAWRDHPDSTTARGRRWHEGALRRAIRRADAFVVPSGAVATGLAAAGADPVKVHIVAEGADHLAPPDRAAADAVLRRAGVSGRYLLAVSTLEPRKNLRRLVSAYRVARPQLPEPIPLVVAGPLGWGDSGLGADEAEGVLTVGRVEGGALSALYAGASAFVYVPLVEGFGLPPIEAMAAGVPVVVSASVPSVSESPIDGVATVVDPTDEQAIARAMVAMFDDPNLAATLVANGRALAAMRTWETAAAGHVAVWDSLS